MRHLEIACFSVESAIIAHKAGASRIELCADPAVGGVTPSLKDLQAVKHAISDTPIHVMVRPRGGSFVYTEQEIAQMHKDIASMRPWADGFVFGVLSGQDTFEMTAKASDQLHSGGNGKTSHVGIDVNVCQSFLETGHSSTTTYAPTNTFKYTFHRAFDEVEDWRKGLASLADCGFDAVLVSGHENAKAIDHTSLLKEMVNFTQSQQLDLQIMVGGSVRSENLQRLVSETDAIWYHSSAIVDDGGHASYEEIKKMIAILESF